MSYVPSTQTMCTRLALSRTAVSSSMAENRKPPSPEIRAKLFSFAIHAEGSSTTEGRRNKRKSPPPPQSVDKSILTHPEPRRIRDREHVRFVSQQTCLVCGRQPCDAHHLRFTQNRALGRRVSDEFTVPLCRGIIARSIVTVMKPGGGRNSGSIRPGPPARCGS
jgi:hypothetical protein